MGFSFSITFLYRTYCTNTQAEQSSLWVPSAKTERKISHLLYMNELKLLVRDEDKLENGIKIVKTIGTDINMKFVLKNCANIL